MAVSYSRSARSVSSLKCREPVCSLFHSFTSVRFRTHPAAAQIGVLAASIPEYDYFLKRAASLLACVALAALVAGCGKDRSTETDAELGLNAQQASGRQIFKQHCATCHSAYTSTGDHGPGLNKLFRKQIPPEWVNTRERKICPANHPRRSRRMMPPQGESLTEQQLDDVLAYLHTLVISTRPVLLRNDWSLPKIVPVNILARNRRVQPPQPDDDRRSRNIAALRPRKIRAHP